MRRSFICLLLLAITATTAAIVGAGCGFGRADDTGQPIPGPYWGWVCPNGEKPGDAGCLPADSGAFGDGRPSAEAGAD